MTREEGTDCLNCLVDNDDFNNEIMTNSTFKKDMEREKLTFFRAVVITSGTIVLVSITAICFLCLCERSKLQRQSVFSQVISVRCLSTRNEQCSVSQYRVQQPCVDLTGVTPGLNQYYV
ncbi:uncharacterized protein LOC143239412 [Tachypleus tridentatus]|uniref:uncharacterized protein LOC143239412 n=1 Tax=Tachypleus tridentatus TaxID=6853 RepID=UPI003FD23C0A